MKPLGRKAYGSIPHLPNSRMGSGDHSCHEGQSRICTEDVRDSRDRIIVTEKLDGSCMAVAKINGEIIPIARSGYHAKTSPFEHIQEFAGFVSKNTARFDQVLLEGQRIVGEWMNVATGTLYKLPHEPFVAFDLMEGAERCPYDQMLYSAMRGDFVTARCVHDGGAVSIDKVMSVIGEAGFHGALEPVEGAVWRVERDGVFDFLAKFVRHDKVDGKYLKGLHGNDYYTMNEAAQ